jgi:hypothetical protein
MVFARGARASAPGAVRCSGMLARDVRGKRAHHECKDWSRFELIE